MPRSDLIIAVAGWEERFALGIKADIESYAPPELTIIVFEEYLAETAANRAKVKALAEARNIVYREVPVRRSEPSGVWKTIHTTFSGKAWASKNVTIDITTMPREVIWWTLSALQLANCTAQYVYYRPGEYSTEWVTRDTDRPRLVYQCSGVSEFGRDTCLLLVSGFDIDRAAQMIQFFEPSLIRIGLQSGRQFGNQVNNVKRNKDALSVFNQARFFELDAYGADHGLAAMEEAVAEDLEKYNIVAASLGPKLSAIALHEFHQKNSNLALAYAPSRQFNSAYSKGIGEAVAGIIHPQAALSQ